MTKSHYECAKCQSDLKDGTSIVEGGQLFMFCKECADLLEKAPTGNTIHNFLGAKAETWVAKNMRKARQRRAAGIKLWPEKV